MKILKENLVLDGNWHGNLVMEESLEYIGMEQMKMPEDVARLMNDVFQMDIQAEERLYLICLTNKCHPISFFEISHGTYDAAMANPREIFIRALLCAAAGIILVHNHPSGDCSPSKEDCILTRRIRQAAEMMGIHLNDHIIIGRNQFYSFREHEML